MPRKNILQAMRDAAESGFFPAVEQEQERKFRTLREAMAAEAEKRKETEEAEWHQKQYEAMMARIPEPKEEEPLTKAQVEGRFLEQYLNADPRNVERYFNRQPQTKAKKEPDRLSELKKANQLTGVDLKSRLAGVLSRYRGPQEKEAGENLSDQTLLGLLRQEAPTGPYGELRRQGEYWTSPRAADSSRTSYMGEEWTPPPTLNGPVNGLPAPGQAGIDTLLRQPAPQGNVNEEEVVQSIRSFLQQNPGTQIDWQAIQRDYPGLDLQKVMKGVIP